jgi:membrane associated rhomboid family serine protease
MSDRQGGGIMSMFTLMNETNFNNPLTLFRLVSHVAGHASLEHLMGNMTFVLLLGPIIEERYGSQRMLIMIVVTALLTALANIFLFSTGLLGASGIVFMLIILVSITNVSNGEIPLTFILVAILFIGKEVLASFAKDNVSNFAHIFGGICGSFFGFSRK